jgi:hypothetical protein
MQVKKAVKKQVKTKAKAKKSANSKEPKEVTVTANGKRFKVIPPKNNISSEEYLKLQAEVRKIVEKMLNGMNEGDYVAKCEVMMLLIDTDVFLRAFRDSNFLELIKPFNPTVCTVVNIEAIQGKQKQGGNQKVGKSLFS